MSHAENAFSFDISQEELQEVKEILEDLKETSEKA